MGDGSPSPEVAWGVQTVTVESRGGKVGIAPQALNAKEVATNKTIKILVFMKYSLSGSHTGPS